MTNDLSGEAWIVLTDDFVCPFAEGRKEYLRSISEIFFLSRKRRETFSSLSIELSLELFLDVDFVFDEKEGKTQRHRALFFLTNLSKLTITN